MNGIFFTVGYTVSFLLGTVVGTGQFAVRLHSYDNPKGTDYNGTCCDSDVAECKLDKCDFKFDICIGKERGGHDCTYGKKQIITTPNTNTIDFNIKDNVLRFQITNSLKDPLFIRVNVTDQDTGGSSVMVDSFHLVFNSAAYYNDTVIEYTDYLITGERKQHPSKLNVSVASFCDQNYYGSDCDINCVAENFGCNGHYKCGAQGEKICNPGWTSADCDVQIPGGEGDCGFYKDSTELLPSLWVGTYTCPGELPQMIQMNVTQKNAGEIQTSAVLSFAGISVTTSGTYGYRILFTQGTLNQSNITDVIFHGMQPPMNLSSMTGSLEITQKSSGKRTCSIVLNMQKSYFNQCGAGTCVRYGQKKEEYYCCCGDKDKAATYCGSTTSTTTTTPPSTTPVTTEAPTTPKQTTQKPTTSQPTTPETTTTNKPTTQEITTSTTTSTQPTTLEKTTTQPTTTTTQPTTSTTKEKTTTESITTTVTTEAPTQPLTTVTTTTKAPRPSSTVKPTTNKVPVSAPAVQILTGSFFINLLGDEIDSTLSDAVKDAYIEANKDQVTLQKGNVDFPTAFSISKYIFEQRKYRGELLSLVEYNISFSGVSIKVKQPTKKEIQAQVTKRYAADVRLYDVGPDLLFSVLNSFQLNIYGPGPADAEMAKWERVILDVYKSEQKCNSSACPLYDISIKNTDEYMDYNGSVVTKLYIFVLLGAVPIRPPNIKDPYIEALQNNRGINAKFYTGSLDAHELLWYRQHYDLFVEGSVVQGDLPKFKNRIQDAWYKAESGYNCPICNVVIHRTENYIGENGEPLTAIVYFFQIRQIFSLPYLDGPMNYLQYLSVENLTDINGNQYKLYNGSKQYRYSHAYNLLVKGRVDPKDRNQFTAAIKQAWLDYNASLASITPSEMIEEYIDSTSGDIVSNIVCFVSLGGVEIDARLISTPSMSWLHNWTIHQSQLSFSRAGGQTYEVYTKRSPSELYLRTELFSMYFEGYIKLDHWADIAESLKRAWNSTTTFSGKRIDVKILGTKTFSVYKKRESVITMLWYALLVDSKLVSPVGVPNSQRDLVYNISMVSLAAKYSVYVLKDRLLDRMNQFTLYFTTKINYLDFDVGIQAQLLGVIRRKWTDSKNYKNLDLYIDYQEKVYGANNSVLWKLVFYLMSNNIEINSQFVKPITHQLFQSVEIKGISGQVYHLYTGQRSSTWLYFNSHFSLTFTSEVSKLEWFRVERMLKLKWCNIVLNCGSSGQNVSISIKEQRQYWDDSARKWYWQLVYFVRHGTALYSSKHHSTIDASKLDFSWDNVYNSTYSLVVNPGVERWRFSRSFYLWTEQHLTVNAESIQKIRMALLQAWYKMNLGSGFVDLKTCNCISIRVLPQRSYYAGNGKTIWKLTYFILYKNKVVLDGHLWPVLNATLIDWRTVTSTKVKVRTDVDLYYYRYMLHFKLNHKLSVSEYGEVEKAMTQQYIEQHPVCGCRISIAHQEEVIDSHGKSSWIVYYHIMKNGVYQKPTLYHPFKWNLFNTKYVFTSSDGHKLHFTWSWTGSRDYFSYSQSGSLFLQTWVPPSLYGRFGDWLQWYYQNIFQGSKVEVKMTNTTREYKKKDGSSAWQLPFIVKVNGSVVTPPAINSTTFHTTFNTTTSWKQHFTLVHPDEVTDKHKIFSVHLNHKVSETAKEDIKKAIIATYVQQHSGVNSSLVNLTFGSQQEIFSNSKNNQTEKSSSWELSYTISVGGSKVDSRGTTSLNTSLLTSNLNVTGPNKVKYSVVTNTESTAFIAASRVSSLYVNSFVSVEDIKKLETKIALAWKKQYNSSEEVKVSFLRQKEYINSNGKVVWKWDYTLTLNSSHVVRAKVPAVDHTRLQTAVGSLISVTGRKYQMVLSTANFLDFQMHFPLYLTTKMAKENEKDFKKRLQEAWAKKGLGAVSVQIVKQEELIHKSTGISSWKLVYFLKRNATKTVVDSRVTENLNASELFPIVGPQGTVYVWHTNLDASKYLTRSMSKSVTINTKLDINGKIKLREKIAQLLKKNVTEAGLKSTLSVEIAGQEEYFTKQNTRAWNILYFIKLGGQYVPASSLVNVNQEHLATLLANVTTVHGQKLTVIKKTDLSYSYRNAFSIYFTSKLAASHFSSIQLHLLRTWEKSREYQNCNCLAIDEITKDHLEEVVDSKGVSYWKLSYFLRTNSTLIESMTHKPLEIVEFSKVLANVTNVKGQPYMVKSIKEMVMRSRLMFTFYMETEIGYGQREKFETSLKAAWTRQQPGTLKGQETSVKIYRSTRFVNVVTRSALWQVDYVIKTADIVIDPLEIPSLPPAELQKNLTFTNPRGVQYQVLTHSDDMVDYRIHFALYLKTEVKFADFSSFEGAVEQYWTSEGYTNANASISFQERYVNKYGKILWKLVVFVRTGSVYVDSRTSEDVNTTQLQTSITGSDTRGRKYQLVTIQSETLRRYASGLSVVLSRAVLRSDLIHVTEVLRKTWTEAGVGLQNVSVEILSQENYVSSKRGLVSKILYYLSVGGATVDSGMLGNVNSTALQQKLTSLSTSYRYHVVMETDVYRYEWLFTLDLMEPLLTKDYKAMEHQLAAAWMVDWTTNFKNSTVKIMSQESLISEQGASVSRVLYTLNGDLKMRKATQLDPLPSRALMKKITLLKSGTSYQYITRLYGGSHSVFRYSDLYTLDLNARAVNYTSLEGQLVQAWNSSMNASSEKIQKVTIIKQEKILLNDGESAFRLLYHVQSENTDFTMNRQLISGPSHDALIKHVRVENSAGVSRRVLNVSEGFRMAQVFSVVMNRQVFLSDKSKFENSLLQTLKSTWTDISSTFTFTVRSEERVVDKTSGQMLWRYSYVAKTNGNAIDVSRQLRVSSMTLTSALNFTSPRKQKYVAVDKEVLSYNEMFSLQVEGIQNIEKTRQISDELKKEWSTLTVSASVGNLFREEYLSKDGTPVTKFSYYVKDSYGDAPIYPSVTRPPVYAALTARLGLRLLTGGSSVRYSDCFRLYLSRPQWSLNRSSIEAALTQTWQQHSQASSNVTVSLVNGMDSFVGSYGLQISAFLYTISYQSSGLTRVITPDITVHPDFQKVQSALSSQNSKLTVYRFTSYRTRSLFHLSVTHLTNVSMSARHVRSLSSIITQAWKDTYNTVVEYKGLESQVVSTKEYRTMNGGSWVSRVYYRVEINNKTVEPWEGKLQSSAQFNGILTKLLQNDSSLSGHFILNNETENKVYSIFIKGHYKDFTRVRKALQNSWQTSITSGAVIVTTIGAQKYVSDSWKDVTKLKYSVTINGSSPEALKLKPPSFDAVEAELQKVNKSQCPCYTTKARKEYLLGSRTSIKVNKVQMALKSVWSNKNPDIDSQKFTVRVKDITKRQKRDTESATIETKLVGNGNREVTPVQYTVALEGHDPDPTFVDTPSGNDLTKPLGQAGAAPCGCSPKLAGTLKLKGKTDPKEKQKITNAIADAFAKQNQDVSKNNIKTEAKLSNTKSDGNDVTVVDYSIQRNDDGPVEDLKSPKRVDLERSLNTAGKTLYSKAPVAPPEEEDKKMAIYIAVAVVAFIILVLIICYVVYIRRHRKKGNLLKREQEVKENNAFDTEHFSEPAASQAYQNPNYEQIPSKQDLRNV